MSSGEQVQSSASGSGGRISIALAEAFRRAGLSADLSAVALAEAEALAEAGDDEEGEGVVMRLAITYMVICRKVVLSYG